MRVITNSEESEAADIAAPEPKKAKAKGKGKAKGEKKLGPKLVPNTLTKPHAAAGDNSGANPALIELMDETLGLDEKIAALNKSKRDIRNRVKTEFGILAWNWSNEIAMRKLDKDVRIQRESGAHDLKNMLGYQIALDLQAGTVERTENQLVDPSAPRDDIINRQG